MACLLSIFIYYIAISTITKSHIVKCVKGDGHYTL
uniref:Uncharacterized protein n=1 Tax=Anguilla anguilla TaxID=7936 RepID=A0A0E9W6I7_ANGAN